MMVCDFLLYFLFLKIDPFLHILLRREQSAPAIDDSPTPELTTKLYGSRQLCAIRATAGGADPSWNPKLLGWKGIKHPIFRKVTQWKVGDGLNDEDVIICSWCLIHGKE